MKDRQQEARQTLDERTRRVGTHAPCEKDPTGEATGIPTAEERKEGQLNEDTGKFLKIMNFIGHQKSKSYYSK
jgi:hypothetical protein